MLIVNADDWGRDRRTTDVILDCIAPGGVSSVSAMVYMEDSERAASVAHRRGIDAGLHLNFTTPFSSSRCPAALRMMQRSLTRYLRSHRFAPVIPHPGLRRPFEELVSAQIDEFRRLYGADPDRIDGHHHMHLCANILVPKLLPAGTLVRRNFSFGPGEKGWLNRRYRDFVDRRLRRRHRVVDFLFPLAPMDPSRLRRIGALASEFVVELETHPVEQQEYVFLLGGRLPRHVNGAPLGSHSRSSRL